MKKLVPLVLMFLLVCISVIGVSPLKEPVFKVVYVPDPIIIVTFLDELSPVNITDYVLVKGYDIVQAELAQVNNESNGTNVTFESIPLNHPIRSTNLPWSFNFTSEQTLGEGKYTFRIVAEDSFGNSALFYDFFDIKKVPFNLSLVEPSYGVSSTSKFAVRVETTFSSECRFNKFDVGFDVSSPFSSTGRTVHTVNYAISSANMPESFFVYCKNDRGEISKGSFNLSFDPTEPVIKSLEVVNAFDGKINEPSRRADLVVVTDEPTQCFYSLDRGSHKLVSDEFSVNTSFSESDLKDGSAHIFNVYCVNKAGLKSDSEIANVLVDTSLPLLVKIVSPEEFVSSSVVNFLIKTSKSSTCYLSDLNGSVVDLTESQDHKSHTGSKTFLSEGKKKFNLVCDFLRTFPDGTAGSDSIKEEFEFVIDSSPPVITNVTDEGITSSLSSLSAVIVADDPGSGIARYYYAIRKSTSFDLDVINWTESSSRDIKVSGLNLSNGVTYVFDAIVTNGAGLNSSKVSSKGVLVDTSYSGVKTNASLVNGTAPVPADPDVSRPEDEVDDLAERLPLAEQPAFPEEEGGGFSFFTLLLVLIAIVLVGAGGWVAWQYTQSKKAPPLPARPSVQPAVSRRAVQRPKPFLKPAVRVPTVAERAKDLKDRRKAAERNSLFSSFETKKPEVKREEKVIKKEPFVKSEIKPAHVIKKSVQTSSDDFKELSLIKEDVFGRLASMPSKQAEDVFDNLSKFGEKDFEKLAEVYKDKGEEGALDALDKLSAPKKADALDALDDLIGKKEKKKR